MHTVFRREPIWKVSMSVRLRPAVRCSFDEAQGALRVTLKERAEDEQEEQLVIYALRVRVSLLMCICVGFKV